MRRSRILVLVPHPDDEVVGCSAAIERARASGSSVSALYLTTGVAPEQLRWPWERGDGRVRRRRDEALRVAEDLDLDVAAFLDWPSRTLKEHLAEVRAVIESTIESRQIDTLWTPAWEGGHQDHDVTNHLAARVEAPVARLEFSEYHFAHGRVQSQRFIAACGGERLLALTEAEQVRKRRRLAAYRSERGNLRHVQTKRECLRPLPAYDYARPPHAGTLFYERFHWVPFRHPRIDFTRGEEVCRTLAREAHP